jgi:hypothetical protein
MLRALLATAVLAAGTAHADVLTQWNFNSPVPDGNLATGTLAPSIGSGTASLVGGTTATFASGVAGGGSTDPAPSDNSGWNVTAFAAQGSGDLTRGVQFAVDTTGYTGVVVRWDQRHSNTAAAHVQFQYSLDGLSFTNFGAPFVADAGDAWFNGRAVDLGSVAGVADNASFAFRIVASFAPGTSLYAASNPTSSYAASGTWRFDMVTVSAAPIPEPSTYALLALGLLAVTVAARRRA